MQRHPRTRRVILADGRWPRTGASHCPQRRDPFLLPAGGGRLRIRPRQRKPDNQTPGWTTPAVTAYGVRERSSGITLSRVFCGGSVSDLAARALGSPDWGRRNHARLSRREVEVQILPAALTEPSRMDRVLVVRPTHIHDKCSLAKSPFADLVPVGLTSSNLARSLLRRITP